MAIESLLRRGVAALLLAAAAGAACAQAASPFDEARFSVVEGAGGVPLNVVELGDPALPPVLLIHGYRQSYLSWWRQFGSGLPKRCRLVAFDLRGHGNSGQPWQVEAYDNSRVWADDVARVIEARGLKRPLLVGWSFGGNVIMDFMRHHGDVPLAGLLFTGTPAGMATTPPPPPAVVAALTGGNLERSFALREGFMNLIFPPGSVEPALRDKFVAAAARVSGQVDRGLLQRPPTDNRDIAASVRVPVTAVFGGKDPAVPAPAVEAFKAALPKARVQTFDNAGHQAFLDDAERFNALLDEMQCAPRAR